MLLLCLAIGAAAGLFMAKVKLGLGMPGHKIFFWMTPVLIARLRGKCRIGTTAGGISATLTAYALSGNLVGGIMGLPTAVLGGFIMDLTADRLEKSGSTGVRIILMIGLAGVVANLVCLGGRVMRPAGLNPHFLLGLSTSWFRLCSYIFFGFASGIVAALSARLGCTSVNYSGTNCHSRP